MDHLCNEGTILLYYANHKDKEIGNDLVYCDICYPGNTCETYFGNKNNWIEISASTYEQLRKEGYKEIDF